MEKQKNILQKTAAACCALIIFCIVGCKGVEAKADNDANNGKPSTATNALSLSHKDTVQMPACCKGAPSRKRFYAKGKD